MAARTTNWSSASALNALFKDKASVKRLLNEVITEGDLSGLHSSGRCTSIASSA